jgi:hypothetical protein
MKTNKTCTSNIFDENEVTETSTLTLWTRNNIPHRVDGPAMVFADGREEWYLNGLRHRIGGPAVTWADGYREWYQNGRYHRDDGPAIISANNEVVWKFHNNNMVVEEYETAVRKCFNNMLTTLEEKEQANDLAFSEIESLLYSLTNWKLLENNEEEDQYNMWG